MKLIEYLVFVFGLFLFSMRLSAQKPLAINKSIKLDNYPFLSVDTSFNAEYLADFMVPFSQFGDLQQCKIKIKSKKLKTTMAARPSFFSLFVGKSNRRYIILVNNDDSFKGVLLSQVPQEARIGLFAHELMHIRDYEGRSIGGILERGFQYMSQSGKTTVEHYTDSLTIAAGFGKNLFHWATYVLNDSDASEDYKAFKSQVYMSPVHILSQMERHDL